MSKVLYRIVSFIADSSPHAAVPPLLFLFSWAFPLSLHAQDTIQTLDAVEVSAQRTPTTMITANPTQVMTAKQIEQQGQLLLSDAVRQMAGVTLKDYGGVGGMKTVSARGLGSQFSTVTIDGVAVSDAQNGQVDLGRYLLGNAAYISFSQGQQQDPLLSARAYAAGNVLNLESAEPEFLIDKNTNMKVGLEGGSFGFLSTAALWEQRWDKKLKSSLWVNYLKSDGDYPFTLYYTHDHSDSSSSERRLHSAMQMFTADGNLFYSLGRNNTLTTKLHFMSGQHQLPGPVHLYSQTLSAENTAENVAFVQTKWKVEKKKWRTMVIAKWHHTYDRYEDHDENTFTGNYLMNDYRQREAYLSGSASYYVLRWFDLRGAADGSLAALRTNLATHNDVYRQNGMAVAALRIHSADSNHNRFEFNANLLGTVIRDRAADIDTMTFYRHLSPYAGVNVTFGGHTTLRYFYKETYRAPNFSELYFFAQTHNLRPECARQHNIGLTHSYHMATLSYQLTVDGYYNHVTDKILAVPINNMFLWSMQNIGRVEILGVDATANFQLSTFNFQLNYTYQHAVDRTDPSNPKLYGHQIVYTPRHSGGGFLRWENPWVNLSATAMVVGERYSFGQNSPETKMPAYCDVSFSADREFELGNGTLLLQAQVLNLANVQYEVVRSYPMMGRNYRLKVVYNF